MIVDKFEANIQSLDDLGIGTVNLNAPPFHKSDDIVKYLADELLGKSVCGKYKLHFGLIELVLESVGMAVHETEGCILARGILHVENHME